MKLVLDLQTRIGLEPSSCSHRVASSSCPTAPGGGRTDLSVTWRARGAASLSLALGATLQRAVLQGEPHGTSPLFDALSSENMTGK